MNTLKQSQIFIISTGTELIGGKTPDDNGPAISQFLTKEGFETAGRAILPDDPTLLLDFLQIVSNSSQAPDAIIITGGLGATEDDYTLLTVARLLNSKLKIDPATHRRISAYVKKKGAIINPKLIEKQARIPESCTALKNKLGLAPGIFCEFHNNTGHKILLAALPGVPHEMESILRLELLPLLKKYLPTLTKFNQECHLYGIGESTFQSLFFESGEFGVFAGDYSWGVTARSGHIKIFFESEKEAVVQELTNRAHQLFGQRLLNHELLELLHNECSIRKVTMALAESCTGGLASRLITRTPGCSSYFQGSVVSYSNHAKEHLIGVNNSILTEHGAVSAECAVAMACGVRQKLSADFAVSITGIAGPDGGTEEKPVGTVYFGLCGKNRKTFTTHNSLPGDRIAFQEHAARLALFYLYCYIRDEHHNL